METYKLSFIPIGKMFTYQGKAYTKTNRNRGWFIKEDGSKGFHKFKKNTKVQYKESLKGL